MDPEQQQQQQEMQPAADALEAPPAAGSDTAWPQQPPTSPRGRTRRVRLHSAGNAAIARATSNTEYTSIATAADVQEQLPSPTEGASGGGNPLSARSRTSTTPVPPSPYTAPTEPNPPCDDRRSNISIADTTTCDPMQKTPETWKEKCYSLLEPDMPTWSPRAQRMQTVLSIAVFLVIVVSVMCFCIESLPEYYNQDNMALRYVEGTCVMIFTVEVAIRTATCPSLGRFVRDPLNWIDFISIVPWYITLIFSLFGGKGGRGSGSLVVFRVIRLVRVFRVFKLSKYSRNLQLVAVAVARSLDALTLLLFLIIICLLLFSSGVFIADQTVMSYDNETNEWWYFDEDRQEDRKAPFQSIPHAFWWCIVTLTTVGYGDDVPVSWPGKFIAAIAMLCGLLVAAFPVVLIGNNFNEALAEQKTRQKRQQAELVSRMLGQEPTKTPASGGGHDEAPDQETVATEIESQLTRLRSELEIEFGKLGVELTCLKQTHRDNRHGIPLGTTCASFVFNGLAHIVYITSYGQPAVPDAVESRNLDAGRSYTSGPLPLRVLVRRFNERVRILEKARDSKNRASVTFQFRYEPLLYVNCVYSTSRDVARPAADNASAGGDDDAADTQHIVLIEVFLDSDLARKLAHTALMGTGEFPRAKLTNVCATPLQFLTGTVPGLDKLMPDVKVRCEHERPRSRIHMCVEAPDALALQRVEAVLPKMTISFECSSSFGGDTTATIPLAAYSRLFADPLPFSVPASPSSTASPRGSPRSAAVVSDATPHRSSSTSVCFGMPRAAQSLQPPRTT